MHRKLVTAFALLAFALPVTADEKKQIAIDPNSRGLSRTEQKLADEKVPVENIKPAENLPQSDVKPTNIPLPPMPTDMSSNNVFGLIDWLDDTATVMELNGGDVGGLPSRSFNTPGFLSLSFAPDRSAANELGGAEFSLTDPAYIFLDGLGGNTAGTFVIFSINGSVVFDPTAPFDLGGTANDGTAIAVDPELFRDGVNSVSAIILSPQGFGFTFAFFGTNEGSLLLDVAEDAGLTILVDAVEAAGLTDALNSAGPFTVLAPTNEAFLALLADLELTAEELFANTELLTQVLTYHVIPGRFTTDQLAANAPLATLEGTAVNIEDTGNGFVINPGIPVAGDVDIIIENVNASNGIAQVIDTVLLPPKNLLETAEDAGLTILVDAVEAAGLTDTLNQPGPFTVFAPTNAAFEQLLADLDLTAPELFANTELLTTVLLYHVVPGNLSAEELAAGTPFTTVQGSLVNIVDNGGNFVVNPGVAVNGDVNVALTNVRASNGQAQVIDTVLLPPADLLDTAAAAGLTTLVDAVDAAGLRDALTAEGQSFTVFAPTNDAFATLLAELNLTAAELFADTELLTTVLLYHVVNPVAPIDSIVANGGTATLEGTDVEAERNGDGTVVLNGTINVLAEDVLASNGFAQVIDGVLLPAMNPGPQLAFGLNADGSDALALDGAEVDAGQPFFILLTPLQPEEDITVVFFALNGSFLSLDTQAPYFLNDFFFGNQPSPVNPARLVNGTNLATAFIQTAGGETITVNATFEVSNLGTP